MLHAMLHAMLYALYLYQVCKEFLSLDSLPCL